MGARPEVVPPETPLVTCAEEFCAAAPPEAETEAVWPPADTDADAVAPDADVDTFVPEDAPAPVDLADLEAQPVRTRPAAMSENTTEILIFLVRLFMVVAMWLTVSKQEPKRVPVKKITPKSHEKTVKKTVGKTMKKPPKQAAIVIMLLAAS